MLDLTNTTLDDIAGVVGFSATVRLAAYYGGQDLHVPHEVSELHPVAKLIGVSRLKALSDAWKGERVSVPTLAIIANEGKYGKMLLLMSRNYNDDQIANLVDIGRRRVGQIRKDFEAQGLL